MYILYLSRSTTSRCLSPDHNCTKIYACMSYITICTVWCISRGAHTAHAQTSRSIAHTINAAAISRTLWITQQPIKKEHNSTVGMWGAASQQLTHIFIHILCTQTTATKHARSSICQQCFVERFGEASITVVSRSEVRDVVHVTLWHGNK